MWITGRQLVVFALVFTLLGYLAGTLLHPTTPAGWSGATAVRRTDARPRPAAPRPDLQAGERHTVELFAQASPSIVYITTLAVQAGDGFFSVRGTEVPVRLNGTR